MKLIIYWLTLMVILPLLYLFWWKKKKRIIIGLAILAILALGIFLSEEIIHSIIWREIDKESKNKIRKLDDILKKVSEQKIDAENPQEKIDQAKEIIELKKEIKNLKQNDYLFELRWLSGNVRLNNLKREWISKWSQEKFLSALFFCGEEFNKKLAKGEYQIFEGEEKWKLKKKIDAENIIDFANYQNNDLEAIEKKLSLILIKEEIKRFDFPKNFSIVWLKNIDKIVKTELENFLIETFDPTKTNSLINKKRANLLKFIFIFTTSNSSPKISKNLLAKLHRVETWEKYSIITIIIITGGLEVVVFLFLIRNKKNSKNKVKEFNY